MPARAQGEEKTADVFEKTPVRYSTRRKQAARTEGVLVKLLRYYRIF
jgi:hypothetical protein